MSTILRLVPIGATITSAVQLTATPAIRADGEQLPFWSCCFYSINILTVQNFPRMVNKMAARCNWKYLIRELASKKSFKMVRLFILHFMC